MRPTKGELRLAASSVRIARRRMREYIESGQMYTMYEDINRWDALLRRALELLGEDPDGQQNWE